MFFWVYVDLSPLTEFRCSLAELTLYFLLNVAFRPLSTRWFFVLSSTKKIAMVLQECCIYIYFAV